jgi:hypothetical protein
MEKEKPQHQIVLEMLQAHPGGVTTGVFCSTMGLAAEYRRAISDLRRKGYIVNASRLCKGSFNYVLIHQPEVSNG